MRRIGIAGLLEDPGEIAQVKDLLATGGVAAIPTETFYGLAADPRSAEGVRRVYQAKGREEHKPLPVVFSGRDQLEELGVAAAEGLLARYFAIWPAPLTVVLPLIRPIPASCGLSALAVRVPASPELVVLLESVGALTATSANLAGYPAFSDPDEVARTFERTVDLLVDGGPAPGGKPSTLIDATVEPPVLLRSGAFPWPC